MSTQSKPFIKTLCNNAYDSTSAGSVFEKDISTVLFLGGVLISKLFLIGLPLKINLTSPLPKVLKSNCIVSMKKSNSINP
jgi:predicted cobalt transporter CbtA